jgi:hypothetical protein
MAVSMCLMIIFHGVYTQYALVESASGEMCLSSSGGDLPDVFADGGECGRWYRGRDLEWPA